MPRLLNRLGFAFALPKASPSTASSSARILPITQTLAATPTPLIARAPLARLTSPSASISTSRFISPSLARPTSLLSSLTLRPPSRLSSSPSSLQIRCVTYGTNYQPSQRKRKRKHGFLVRSKGGRSGRATLARRRIRGRRFLSH